MSNQISPPVHIANIGECILGGHAVRFVDSEGKELTYTEVVTALNDLALVTAERDKAIERSAILGLAVDHYADIRNWYCPQCNVGGESPDCPLVSLRCSNNHQGFDIAVKAKKEAEEVGK